MSHWREWFTLLSIVFFLAFVVYLFLLPPRRQSLGDELLQYFTEGKEMTVSDLSERIETTTGGRRSIPDRILYCQLDALVKRNELSKMVKICISSGSNEELLERVFYSLPKKEKASIGLITAQNKE